MKKPAIILILFIFAFAEINAQSISVMTYNIRYDSQNDGENVWNNRKQHLSDLILFNEPGIFGIQEGLIQQLNYIDSSLVNYSYFGRGRDKGKMAGEYSAIFYDTIKFELINESTFWLSETPNKSSKSWDAALPRICTYGHFKEIKTGNKFWVFNTHFDHIGIEARKESAKLILKKIEELTAKRDKIVLMGDFNLTPDSEAIQTIKNKLSDSFDISDLVFGKGGTFTGFDYNNSAKKRIDYIFVSKKNIKIKKYAVLNNSYNLKFPSDHFPVFIKFELLNN